MTFRPAAMATTIIPPATVVCFPGVRVEREHDGEGWLVLTPNGHGWMHGDRPSALREMRWHHQNQRGRG
jgi:hypothetical protein